MPASTELLPPEIRDSSVWYGAKVAECTDWVAQLSTSEVAEVERATNDPKLHLMMELKPGDIQLVHNHTTLHDRTAFEDYPEPDRKRHLLRLWLAPSKARPLPDVYAERFGSVTPGDRGGVTVPGIRGTILLE